MLRDDESKFFRVLGCCTYGGEMPKDQARSPSGQALNPSHVIDTLIPHQPMPITFSGKQVRSWPILCIIVEDPRKSYIVLPNTAIKEETQEKLPIQSKDVPIPCLPFTRYIILFLPRGIFIFTNYWLCYEFWIFVTRFLPSPLFSIALYVVHYSGMSKGTYWTGHAMPVSS